MEQQYSAEFFRSFVESLQEHCRNHLQFTQFVEVSGYISVEIDNVKKERYVLNEILQSSGNVVSESFCANKRFGNNYSSNQGDGGSWTSDGQGHGSTHSNKENRTGQYESFHQRPMTQSYSQPQQTYQSNQQTPLPYQNLQSQSRPPSSSFQSRSQSSTPQSSPRGSGYEYPNYGYVSPQGYSSSQSGSDFNQDTFAPFQAKAEEVQVVVPPTLTDISDSNMSCPSSLLDVDEVIDLDMFDEDLEPPLYEEDTFQGGPGGRPTLAPAGPAMQRKSKLSPGTLTVIKNSVKQFRRFHFDRSGTDVDLLSSSPETLNLMVLDYFREARKGDGHGLTARTLKNVQIHLDMFLRDNGYPFSLTKDSPFQSSREFLKKKLEEGVKVSGQHTNKHSPVNDTDMENLFLNQQLGGHSFETLTNTMWFMNSKYFAIRRPAEHFNMKWGELTLGRNDQGVEYIERPINGSFSLKVYAIPDNPTRCFVHFYKQFRALRPKLQQDDGSPFYLKYDRNQGASMFLPEALSYSFFTVIWRKLVVGGKIPMNKKIF